MTHSNPRDASGKPPQEAPMPSDPKQDPPMPENPQPIDPAVNPVSPEIPEPTDAPEDPMIDPFDDGNFPV